MITNKESPTTEPFLSKVAVLKPADLQICRFPENESVTDAFLVNLVNLFRTAILQDEPFFIIISRKCYSENRVLWKVSFKKHTYT